MGAQEKGTPVAASTQVADLRALIEPIMQAVATAVGPHCEVVLHDLSSRDLDHTIAAIENGQVTGREVGGPSTNLGLELLRDEDADHDAFGYASRTSDGRQLRSSSVYFRDADGHVIASFCVNVDQTPVQTARAALDQLAGGVSEGEPREWFASTVSDVLDQLIEEGVRQTAKPVPAMTKDDRLAVVSHVEERGGFGVKRAVERVAKALGVSRVTVYNLLEQARSE